MGARAAKGRVLVVGLRVIVMVLLDGTLEVKEVTVRPLAALTHRNVACQTTTIAARVRPWVVRPLVVALATPLASVWLTVHLTFAASARYLAPWPLRAVLF